MFLSLVYGLLKLLYSIHGSQNCVIKREIKGAGSGPVSASLVTQSKKTFILLDVMRTKSTITQKFQKMGSLLALMAIWTHSPAQGATVFCDTMIGYGAILGSPINSDSGFAASLPVMISFPVRMYKAIDLQLGIMPKYLAAYTITDNHTLLSIYPALRIQLSKVFIGAGATTVNFQKSSQSGFGMLSSTLGYYGEFGVLAPITPDFSMGFTGTLSFINSSSGSRMYGPMAEGAFLMRFYLGVLGANRNDVESNEFKGWRYPFGRMR
jgi:hypothetical protein